MLGKYSDLTIIHKQRTWQAHKVIVCSKSPVLEAMIEGLEALEEPILDISQYGSSAAAECFLDYIYTSVYPEPPGDIAPESILNLHVQIFILASTFQVHGLQDYATERFQHDLISLVTEHELFFNLVRRVYKGTTHENPGLRLVVVEMAIAEMQNMLADEGVKWAFLRLTSDVTEFQTEIYEGLMKGMAVKVMPVQPVLCESCGPMDESERGFVVVTCERCKQDRQVMIG
ncbi:hypothetical protein HYFRA_00005620 [Hymenoscyphus fraxineus]|uniref:BTB domain-containing protein n=1 Tax=Hymenoscyphus fraxineus TaxID=746836 RepID=A0A9N9PM17_9HELO|nr:hypothetical protein HYFRA_00005620 [Hymenoscyphus fraxineus]